MGRLLGDPEVWDDSPARPRPAARGLAGLAIGAVAGLLLAFAVVPRPDPPPPEVRLPPAAEAPRLRVEKQVLDSASLGSGPMLLLDAVDLGAQRDKPIRALSGGEQQRLAVAVALANNPPLLLADEPTSQLDRANVRRVVELLKEARDDLGTTVVVVTHDAEVAAAMDRTVTIRDGRISAEGRGGAEYAVVGPTGSLHLPAHALDVLPPGARVVVEVEGDQVVLKPTDGGEAEA